MIKFAVKLFHNAYVSFTFKLLRLLFYKNNNKHRNSFLIINTGFLGDVIITSLLMENEEKFGHYSEIYYLFINQHKELFKEYSGKGRIFYFNLKRYRYDILYKIIMIIKLRKLSFKYAINVSAARGFTNDSLTLFSGALEKYYISNINFYLSEKTNKYIVNYYTNRLFTDIDNEYEKHKLLINWLSNSNKEIHFFNKIVFNTFGISTDKTNGKKIISIAPLTRNNDKNWCLCNFKELIKILSENFFIYLIGSKKQKNQLNFLKDNNANVINLAGKFKLYQLPSILKKSSLFIGNDSGLTHLAAKLNIPTIAIIGGGSYGRFFPIPFDNLDIKYSFYFMDCFGCDWKCKYKEKYCLTGITVQDILKTVDSLIGNIYNYKNINSKMSK